MRKFLIIFCITVFFVSCNEGKKEEEKVRYTQKSDEINTLKAAIQDYEDGNWEAYSKHFADTAKIYHNSPESRSVMENVEAFKQGLAGFSNYEFPDDEDEFEMVVTDDNETWVNYWGEWQATIAQNDSAVEIPVHLTARFVDGKIVAEHAYYDSSIIMSVMEGMAKKQDSISNSNP